MKTKDNFFISPKYRPLSTLCMGAVTLVLGTLAGSAQTGTYLYSGSMTTISLNPGTYDITAYGAQGGNSGLGNTEYGLGGLGAEMSGEFSFSGLTTLTLLVGGVGEGGTGIDGYGGGGGGGSFVVSGSTPLVIAGGGGGASSDTPDGGPGLTTTSGGGSSGIANGGVSGGGGGSGSSDGGAGGGGGGGGYSGDGSRGSGGLQGSVAGAGGGGGSSFEDGGSGGGFLYGGVYFVPSGGFGGGGGGGLSYAGEAPYGPGGGGGGYSGGSGGSGEYLDGGGGGGSIIDSSAIVNLAEASGVASPDGSPNGEIIITAVPEPGTLALAGLSGLSLVLFWRGRK